MIKSPLNYVGGKYKILQQILPLFPKDINIFYDVFGGGANVSVNVNADKVVYNDLSIQVVQMLEAFKNTETEVLLFEIDGLISEFNLSKTNKDGFLALRDRYNKSSERNPIMLFALICYGFNSHIRFNSNGEYNISFCNGHNSFNPMRKDKLIQFCNTLHSKDIVFTNRDFRDFTDVEFTENDFVYLDPPYYNSVACYNENGGWTEQDEFDLYDFIGKLIANNVRFALSNNLSVNPLLPDFIKNNKLFVHEISTSYKNCNYQKKDKSEAKEVLITNY